MRKIGSPEYLGIPVPSPDEQDVLWDMAFDSSPEYITLVEVADTAIHVREEIKYKAIQLEQRHLLDNEVPPNLVGDELQQILDGIELGYKFVIGAITYMHYLRRTDDDTDVHDFLYDLPADSDILPLYSPAVRQKVADNICGNTLAQIAIEGHAQTTPGHRSPAIAANARSYLAHAPLLSVIIEEQEVRLSEVYCNDEKPGESHFADGFAQGIESGLAMYVESHLVTALEDIEAHYS